ncbi:MAG: NYN domain-containing protein [Clostridia bacterium]|nr:NYN domain-containing protein [Clostridia bacterium]
MKNISIFSAIFGSKKEKKPSAVVFVDYEHWFISLQKLYGVKPDIKSWSEQLHKLYDVREISFFANFSHESMKDEIARVREVSNMIVETKNPYAYKKDFTDFIMLDSIYQTAMSKNSPDVFIIFTGDGHFCSVVRFLKNRCRKTVGVYGVKNAFSKQLQETANWTVEVEKPVPPDPLSEYYGMLLRNFRWHEQQKEKKVLAFAKTVQYVSRKNHVQFRVMAQALKSLMKKNYVISKKDTINGNKVTTLVANWDLMKKEGFRFKEEE